MANVPTRQQILDKIDEIREDPNFSTLQVEIDQEISDWLDSLAIPAADKEAILDDLNSYPNY